MDQNRIKINWRLISAPLAAAALLLAVFGLARAGVLAPPVVIDLDPDPAMHTAPVDSTISVTYDQDMDPASVNPQSFAVHARQTGWLTETLSVVSGTITLDPLSPLHAGELVQASATTGLLSQGGEAPLEPAVWEFSTAPWGGNAAFHEHQILANDSSRYAALGDLDGDGDLDAITTSCEELTRVFRNDSSGTFTEAQSFDHTSGYCFTNAELGDLDGDGDLDAILVNYSFTTDNLILLNDGSGYFTESGNVIDSFEDSYGELGDLDGDGDLDLFVASGGFDTGRIRVWKNDSAGNFSLAYELDSFYSHTGVALGDLDNDGDLDAFTAGWDNSYNKVWLNDGTGAFTQAQEISKANTYGVQLGDLDGDRDLDVYLANTAFDVTDLPDEVWLNDGTGTFTDTMQSLDTVASAYPALGDLDADGDLDVYISGDIYVAAPDEVWANDGTGMFTLLRTVDENHPGGLAALGDLDGDGNLDAFTGSLFSSAHGYAVYLNGDWTQAAPVPVSLVTHLVQCPEQPDSFYLIGGITKGMVDITDVYRYDAAPGGGSWTKLANMPQPRRASALACYQGKIYVAGGWYSVTFNSLFIYDIASNSWSQGAHLPSSVVGAMMGAWDGKLYLAGGTRQLIEPYPPVDRVDVYDIATDTWTAGGGTPMPAATDFAASEQAGPYLYLAGGFVGDDIHHLYDKTQRYDMASDTWELGPALTNPQWGGGLAINASRLYILGGYDISLNPFDKVDVLELADWPGDAWNSLGDPLPKANVYPGTACTDAVTGGEVWAVGGGDEAEAYYDENIYYPAEPCLANTFAFDLEPEGTLTGKPGETVTHTLTVTNTGDVPDAYSVLITSTWAAEAPEVVGALDPGESVELLVAVTVPAGARPDDTDSAMILVTSQGNSAQQEEATVTTVALEAPGVDVADSLTQFALPGELVTYTLALTNTGNITDTYDLAYAGNEWEVTLPVTHTTLAAGASIEMIVQVLVPADALAGAADAVTVTATSQADPAVSDSTGLTTTALAVYGVALAPESLAGGDYPGQVVEYTLTVTNRGNITDTFDLSYVQGEWEVTLPVTQTELAAGESIDFVLQVAVPVGAADGEADSLAVMAVSRGDPEVQASSALTTTAVWWKAYLPVMVRDLGG